MFFQRQVLKFKRNYLCTLETEESLPSWLGYCVFPTACDALDKIQILPLAPMCTHLESSREGNHLPPLGWQTCNGTCKLSNSCQLPVDCCILCSYIMGNNLLLCAHRAQSSLCSQSPSLHLPLSWFYL